MDLGKFRRLKQELIEKTKELRTYRDEHGEKPKNPKFNYDKLCSYTNQPPNSTNRLVLNTINSNLDEFYKWYKFKVPLAKRIAKHCVKKAVERQEKGVKEAKQLIKKQQNMAKNMSAAVYKDYWSNNFKILKILQDKNLKIKQKKEQEQRINEFLKLQSDLADKILGDIKMNKLLPSLQKSGKSGITVNLKKLKKSSYKFVSINKKQDDSLRLSLFKGKLRIYQKKGVEWLNTLGMRQISCILADEMGLGKTVQTIAHFSYLAEHEGIWGPHLVVVPTTVLGNWLEEFNRFLPSFKVFAYYGRSAERKAKRKGWSDIDRFNVCVTTYRIISIDAKIFKRKKWFSMVLDEAHLIKNSKTQVFLTLNKIKTINRILLTGTPLQNKLQELWTLMTFLFPATFGNKNTFCNNFDFYLEKAAKTNSSIYSSIIKKLHSILRPLILRRLKKDVEKQLPKKSEEIIECSLSRRQKYLYDQFIMRTTNKNTKNGTNLVQSLNVLMQLRKICNHPDLIDEKISESSSFFEQINLFVPSWIDFEAYKTVGCRLSEGDSSQQKVLFVALLCVQHYKLKGQFHLPDYRRVKLRKTAVRIKNNLTRSYYIDLFSKYTSLPSKLSLPALVIPSYLITHPSLQAFNNHVKWKYNNFIFFVKKVESKGILTSLSKGRMKEADLKKARKAIITPLPLIFSNNINNFIEDSGKMKILYKKLIELRKKKKKVLIFTQMTKMLNYLEQLLSYKGFSYVRLDGSIVTEKRQKIVKSFNENPKIMVFISSTRVGGIGINLTSADTVIFYDSDWNPAVDKQAQDRCHRIGQIHNVTIYRLITSHTIEENILMTSSIKSKIDDIVLNKGNFTLKSLFKSFMKDDKALKNKEDREKRIGSLLNKVEDGEDRIDQNQQENLSNVSEEEETDKNQNSDFNDQISVLRNEIRFITNVMPGIFHYGIDVLKLTGCIDKIEDELANQSPDSLSQEPVTAEDDNNELKLDQILQKRNLDVVSSNKDQFIRGLRKKLKTDRLFR